MAGITHTGRRAGLTVFAAACVAPRRVRRLTAMRAAMRSARSAGIGGGRTAPIVPISERQTRQLTT
jgi:hypothetical protein